MDKRSKFIASWCLSLAAAAFGQTQVDLRTQSKSVDFSSAGATKPAKTGTALPSTCGAGEVFFNLSATAGQNLYLCAAANTWTQLTTGGSSGGGGGSATSTSGLTDLIVAKTSATTLSIGANCSTAAPCNVRFGNRTATIVNPATVTVPSGATGVAYIYLTSQGILSVGDSMNLQCNACSEQPGVTQFPFDAIPLFTWSATTGTWDNTGGVDLRAFLSTKNILAGTGIITTESAGQTVVSVDSTVAGVRVAVPGSATSACSQGNYAADTSYFYQCVAANTWRRVAIVAW